jgi:hypothetical protein
MIVVLNADDIGIGSANPTNIYDLVTKLRHLGYMLQNERDFNEFLGIKMKTHDDGSIKLTQTDLIDQILEETNMLDCNPSCIPAKVGPLGLDPTSEPMAERWNYRSVIDKLLRLSTNTRCDITFAVSQVARYSANPKQSHSTAVKTILRYLKKTRAMGMTIKPTDELTLDLFVDDDVTIGLPRVESTSHNTSISNSTHSQIGWIVKLAGCPLIWDSSLQTSNACSTLESKSIALSTAVEVLIPLRRLLLEACNHLGISKTIWSTIQAHGFEDCQESHQVVANQRNLNQSHWNNNRWHLFWQHINDGAVEIKNCNTDLQDADYFTRALTLDTFEANRLRVQKW